MEEQLFNDIRAALTHTDVDIKAGKMMSSEAITYKGKVFAFFSRKKRMVFKLGKDFDPDRLDIPLAVFNPFKNRGPLNGWFELDFSAKEEWEDLALTALRQLKTEL